MTCTSCFRTLFVLHFVALDIVAIWAFSSRAVRELFHIMLFTFIGHYLIRLIIKELHRKQNLDRQIRKVFFPGEENLPERDFLQRTGLAPEILSARFGRLERYSPRDYRRILKRLS